MRFNDLIIQTLQALRFTNGKAIFNDDIERLQLCTYKVKPFYFPFKNAVTTINSTIYLPTDFDTWTQQDQQAVLIHESTHLKQYKAGVFNLYEYLTSRVARFKLEIEAERRETLYRCYINDIRESHIGEYAINMANTWPQQYLITGLKSTAEWFQLFRTLCEESFKFLASA